MPPRKRHKSGFGSVRALPSGRYQARYVGPDTRRHTAPVTFDNETMAWNWLQRQSLAIADGKWTPPRDYVTPTTFGEYAEAWLKDRDLKPRTQSLYRNILDKQLLPALADRSVASISPADVRRWHADLARQTGDTRRAHAYALLKTILRTAVDEEVISANPCRIRGAGTAKRKSVTKPATLEELRIIIESLPEKYRAMTLIATWCGLRFGELIELRRKDIDLANGVIHVRRAAVRVDKKIVVGTPKSEAGVRDVAIPPHLLPVIKQHIEAHGQPGKDGLLFPSTSGEQLAPTAIYKVFYKARALAGRPDLRWHDLRHTGAVLAASTGATLAELMSRLGHSTPAAALRYQHAAQGRDAVIAQRLSELAEG